MIPANMIPVNAIFDSDLHRRTEGTSSASRLNKVGEYIYQTINGEKGGNGYDEYFNPDFYILF